MKIIRLKSGGGLKKAIDVTVWLKKNGLIHGTDYDWYIQSSSKQLIIRFHTNEAMASMTILKYSGSYEDN